MRKAYCRPGVSTRAKFHCMELKIRAECAACLRSCATLWAAQRIEKMPPMARLPNIAEATAPSFNRKSASNRSLERGLEILRAFRPGISLIGNGELAERTGLPKSTVSRLTQTLVESGFLQYDHKASAYRLGVPLLSLGYAMRQSADVLRIALPKMKKVAEEGRINVGMAMVDGTEMVYLESVRRNQTEMFRHVVSGSRVPIELTSLGRAYLWTLPMEVRNALLLECRARHPSGWARIAEAIEEAMSSLSKRGYCSACWQGGITSIATPLTLPGYGVHVINISLSTKNLDDPAALPTLAQTLARLRAAIETAVAAVSNLP